MPLSSTRSDYLREVYFPTVYYAELLEYTIKEVESEQEAFKELDNLILKANANTARLAETYRERAPSPGQQINMRDARYVISQYHEGVASAGASARNKAANPGSAGKAELEDLNISATDNRKKAENAVLIAEKYASKESNPALRRLAYKQIIESVGGDIVSAERSILLAQSVQRLFGKGTNYNAVVSATNSEADKDARTRYANSAGTPEEDLEALAEDPSKPPALRKAAASIVASESSFVHRKKLSGLSPEEEKLRDLFLKNLRDEDSPGEAKPSEFESPEQYAKSREAYQLARDSGGYLTADAEWFAAEFLSAVQTEAALKRRQEEGPTYEDPYREAQRRALKRGGYTPEELHFMAYRGSPAQARVRPSFARAYGDITPQTEQEKKVAQLWQLSGETLDVAALEAELRRKEREFRGPLMSTPYGAARSAVKGQDRKDLRRYKREANKARKEKWSPENNEAAIQYLIALKLRRDGIVKGGLEGVGEPPEISVPLTGDEERALAQDDDALAEAAVAVEAARSEAAQQDEAFEAAMEPEPVAEPEFEQPRITPDIPELGGGVISVAEADPTAAEVTLAPGQVGYEFVDESDATKTRYRRTENGFIALSGQYAGREFFGPSVGGVALTHAERGQYDKLADLQRRQRALRERDQPEARPLPPVTPTVEAGAPPPGAPPTLGLAGPVAGSPFAPLTPEEAARLEARRLEAEGVAPVNLDNATAPVIEPPVAGPAAGLPPRLSGETDADYLARLRALREQ